MTEFRLLEANEIDLIRQIDRGEEIFEYYKRDGNKLVLKPGRETIDQFEPHELERIIQRQKALKQGAGQIIGAFFNSNLIGVASVERKPRGSKSNYFKMDILYVSKNFRQSGVGRRLVEECKFIAKLFGAQKLYISATPTRNTIDFYLKIGAVPASELDSELFGQEPDDIHLEMSV
jgi:GNAT superfamily N-acetyltransferase